MKFLTHWREGRAKRQKEMANIRLGARRSRNPNLNYPDRRPWPNSLPRCVRRGILHHGGKGKKDLKVRVCREFVVGLRAYRRVSGKVWEEAAAELERAWPSVKMDWMMRQLERGA